MSYKPLTRAEIQEAVADESWQLFRLSLKGDSTPVKLRRLLEWEKSHKTRKAEVQVENYKNALRRAGLI